MEIRELNPAIDTESWAFLSTTPPPHRNVMISMRENAIFRYGTPPNEDQYFFRKGAVVIHLENNDIIYNKDDLITVKKR